MPRHAERTLTAMAREAVGAADEFRLPHFLLLDEIKRAAELRVHRGDFHDRRAGDVADIHVVAEIKCARIFRRDESALERGLRHHERLRGFLRAECVEDRREVSELLVPIQLQFAARDFPLNGRDGIVRLRAGVVRRLVIVFERMVRALEILGARRGEEQGKQECERVFHDGKITRFRGRAQLWIFAGGWPLLSGAWRAARGCREALDCGGLTPLWLRPDCKLRFGTAALRLGIFAAFRKTQMRLSRLSQIENDPSIRGEAKAGSSPRSPKAAPRSRGLSALPHGFTLEHIPASQFCSARRLPRPTIS